MHAASPKPSGPAGFDEDAYEILPGEAGAGLILLADHASNRVPPDLADLGLPASEFRRHIAWDIGVAALTRGLSARLGVPAVLSRFSRLVIDPNRGDDDPTLIMRLSDGAVVPGNAGVDAAEREARLARFWRPYHRAIRATIDAGFAAGRAPVVFSLHSFTPVWRGHPRPWHCGVLWDADPRLPMLLLERLRADPTLVVGDNEPYDGALAGDTMYRHGTRRGLAHAILEVRQDLIADAAGVVDWVARLAPILEEAMRREDLAEPRLYGSRTGPVEADR
ncbi:N-formylglutamate amidohydrolase [Pinisolibacter aquiterrae]|uniref:N-formylglutamate amidohydrolase n=1 Tax=Pinisolibacter aquiterrae TaxID=2815579 RepID=UPI001C3DE763|nr:N-formylglutamate amidohydrolase [Pinisolibacter aquiterrae]MBV5263601.1 N-formylglutamate amidohydrolase [Pinisolibacter aquiterrae]MCC8235201.1 N-formylglutamate amidohydrolase [Pinisolibacter aquiterrae]